MQYVRRILILVCALAASAAQPHGGVVFEDDLCVLKLDFLTAHFTGYQPDDSGTEEFCEDIPNVGHSLFVIEFLHDFLREMAFDFRIIEDVNDLGVFANWEDVQALQDIDADTVYYVPPRIESDGVFTAEYNFADAGNFIGVVTARHPTQDKMYYAVFPFAVGQTTWPVGLIASAIGAGGLLAALVFARSRTRRAPLPDSA